MILLYIENIPANNKNERKMIMSNAKITYIQATEDCFSRMSDAKFVKEFEKIHEKDMSENYTVMQAKFLSLKPI